jgi:GMP reductase
MIIHDKNELDFNDVLMLPHLAKKNATSRDDVILERPFEIKPEANRPYKWEGIPIIAANMDTVGTFEMAEALMEYNCCTALHKHYNVDKLIEFFKHNRENEHLLFYTMGISDNDYNKFRQFTNRYGWPKNICIDVANGYLPAFVEYVEKIRKMSPNSIIMAGNVVNSEGTISLLNAGASIVKVGIGNGSACTTRRITGVGRPQFSAIVECANVAHGLNGLVCSDGGCTVPGDFPKAFGAGADFIMVGGMFAGHDESGGKKILAQGEPVMEDEYYCHPLGSSDQTYIIFGGGKKEAEKSVKEYGVPLKTRKKQRGKWVPNVSMGKREDGSYISHVFEGEFEDKVVAMEFYGMSSDTAMKKHNGGMAKYKASEGRTLRIPYRGSIHDTIETILGGIRSNMMYIGALELKEISKCAEFVKVSQQLNTSLEKYEK